MITWLLMSLGWFVAGVISAVHPAPQPVSQVKVPERAGQTVDPEALRAAYPKERKLAAMRSSLEAEAYRFPTLAAMSSTAEVELAWRGSRGDVVHQSFPQWEISASRRLGPPEAPQADAGALCSP